MHIRPLSSLAHSGLFSTVIEKSIGQMLAKPSPAAMTAGIARPDAPVMRMPAPSTPSSAERRKQVRGLMTARIAPPRSRPMVSIKKKRVGPHLLAAWVIHAESLQRGIEKAPHAGLGADIEENADHGEEENGLFQQAEARSEAGRFVGLGFLDLQRRNRDEGQGHEHEKQRECAAPAHALENGEAGHRGDQVGRQRAADALDALRKAEIPAVGALRD